MRAPSARDSRAIDGTGLSGMFIGIERMKRQIAWEITAQHVRNCDHTLYFRITSLGNVNFHHLVVESPQLVNQLVQRLVQDQDPRSQVTFDKRSLPRPTIFV